MSSVAMPAPVVTKSNVWRAQLGSILSAELRKNFISKRAFWNLLALAPVVIVWFHSFIMLQRPERSHPLSKDTEILAGIFQVFFLRPGVFFGCVGIFTYLFRGEIVERTLHHYFLAPVRREVLVAGKFLAGLITAVFFFCGSIALTFAGMYAHYPSHEISEFLLGGPGLSHLAAYVAITALASMAYGALFLWLGIRYKNPVVPAVALLTWESLNLFLPPWLKKMSILYYLRSMAPVEPPLRGPGALIGGVADPASTPVALISLFVLTSVLLWLAVKELQRSEISYSSDS